MRRPASAENTVGRREVGMGQKTTTNLPLFRSGHPTRNNNDIGRSHWRLL